MQAYYIRLKKNIEIYFSAQLIIIFYLGATSGLSFALLAGTMNARLASNGIDISTIGIFSALNFAYSLKFLWAPLIDYFQIPILKRRYDHKLSWLIVCQSLLAICIAFCGFISSQEDIVFLAAIIVISAFIGATSDIVIDSYRINKIPESKQAMASSNYIIGWRIGSTLIGGALAFILVDSLKTIFGIEKSWSIAYLICAILILISIPVVIIFSKKTKMFHVKHSEATTSLPFSFKKFIKKGFVFPIIILIRKHKIIPLFFFIIFYKIGDAMAGIMSNSFFLYMGFTLTDLAIISKGFGLTATILGGIFGGVIFLTAGKFNSLWIALILQIASNLGFIIASILGKNFLVMSVVITVENFCGGVGTTIFVAFLSSLCVKRYSASHYALLSSIASIGRDFIAIFSGFIVKLYGWTMFFTVTLLIALPALLLLYLIIIEYKTKKGASVSLKEAPK